jgi:hypothetical protein
MTRRRVGSLRRHTLAVVALAGALALTAAGCGSDAVGTTSAGAHEATKHTTARPGDRIDPVTFHQDMRKLWEDHITWTRLFIVSAVADLPDLEATAGRLLQNQADIGDAIAPFYGDEAGAALTQLLREHILIAGDLLGAAKAADDAAVEALSAEWYENGDDIAELLAGANPAWPVETLKEMMRGHLDQTLAEAVARLTGDWEGDIEEYDRIHEHILVMADTLADGIVEQFPRRFSR